MKGSVNAGGIHSLNLKKNVATNKYDTLHTTLHCITHTPTYAADTSERIVALEQRACEGEECKTLAWAWLGCHHTLHKLPSGGGGIPLACTGTEGNMPWWSTLSTAYFSACLLCVFACTYIRTYVCITHVHVYWCVHCVLVWGEEECDILFCNPPYDSLHHDAPCYTHRICDHTQIKYWCGFKGRPQMANGNDCNELSLFTLWPVV